MASIPILHFGSDPSKKARPPCEDTDYPSTAQNGPRLASTFPFSALIRVPRKRSGTNVSAMPLANGAQGGYAEDVRSRGRPFFESPGHLGGQCLGQRRDLPLIPESGRFCPAQPSAIAAHRRSHQQRLGGRPRSAPISRKSGAIAIHERPRRRIKTARVDVRCRLNGELRRFQN